MSVAAAILARDANLLPSRRDEAWRWTALRELIREVPAASPEGLSADPNEALEALGAPVILFVNGRLTEGAPIDIPVKGSGVFVRRFVSVSADRAHHLDLSAWVGAGAHLTLIDVFEGGVPGLLASASGVLSVGEAGQVERIVITDDHAEAVSVSSLTVDLAPGARFAQTVLASGARRQRVETLVRHPGQGASLRLDGVYLLGGARHSDQTSVVTHVSASGGGGETVQLCKGVVASRARAVFQGKIVVEPGADGTDARMGHHALILSDRAEVDAKPELEINADDVSCAHGNTVGALDAEALFYARARGIPEPEAKVMLTAAFVGEVVERIEHEGARDLARRWVETQLEALGT